MRMREVQRWSGLHPIRLTLAALWLVLLLQVPASAAIVLGFDSLNDGDAVTTQFPGFIFTNTTVLTAGISLNEIDFPPVSNFNVVSDSGGAITISFDTPVLSFLAYFNYTVGITLTAFDQSSQQVGIVSSLFTENFVSSGNPANEVLQVSNASGIASVTIAGDPLGGSFTMDDVTVTLPDSTGVPEPETVWLVSMVLLAVCMVRAISRK